MNRLTTSKWVRTALLISLSITAFGRYPEKCLAALGKTVEVAIPSIKEIVFANSADKKEYPIPFGKTVTLKAETSPVADLPLTWTTEKVTGYEGVKADLAEQSESTCTFTPGEKSDSGYIWVKAALTGFPDIHKKVKVQVGCSCAMGAGENMCAMPGAEEISLSSISVHLGLGKAADGLFAGDLTIDAESVSTDLAKPKSLEFSTIAGSSEVEALYDNGVIRQIAAPQTFVDVVATSDFSYEIRFYHPGDKGAKTDGFYTVNASATPMMVWRMENPDASVAVYNCFRLTKLENGSAKVYEYAWNAAEGEWSLSRGNGLVIESRTEVMDAGGDRVVTHTTKDAENVVSSVVQTTHHSYPWGEEIIRTVIDPAGAALTTTTEYYQGTGNDQIDGRIKSVINPDGSWTRYEYDSRGRTVKEVRPYLDVPITCAESEAVVTFSDYTLLDAGDINTTRYANSPRTVTETVLGHTVAKSYTAYLANDDLERIEVTERCTSPGAAYGDASNQRTIRTYYAEIPGAARSERLKTMVYTDGRQDTYTYEYGIYTPSADPTQPGTFLPGSGTDERVIVAHGTMAAPLGIPGKTTREISITGSTGEELLQESYIHTAGGYIRVSWTVNAHDELGRVIAAYTADGGVTESTWGCCGKDSETDRTGISRAFLYDDLKRVTSITRHGAPGQADIVTQYTYDASGRRLTEIVTAGDLSQVSTSVYDIAGRLDYTIDAAGFTTDYAYEQNGLATTVTRPGAITEITARYLDGRTKSVTGSGVIPRYYAYGVHADGTQWTQVYTGSLGGPMWEKTTTDLLSRTVKQEKPGYNGTEQSISVYDPAGRLVKTVITGQADTLYGYDELGNQVKSGLDLNASGALEEASTDRINASETLFIQADGHWWQETVQQVFAMDDSPGATTVATQRSRLTGLGGGLTAESIAMDIHGNQTISRATLDRATQTETRTVHYPDSDTNAVSVTVGGRLMSSTGKTGVTVTYGYDHLGRRTTATDPRTGVTTTHYNDNGQVDYVEDPATNRTTFGYDPVTGRKVSETNADGKITRFAYNDQGQVTHTWGDAVYPVQYIYDAYGRMSEMHTYRSGIWNTEAWPIALEGSADITRWRYHEASGFLEQKEDAAAKIVAYTYEAGGRLKTRTWARQADGQPIVTTYGYDPGTGELLTIDYSDNTPDIAFAYDRLGRQRTISDALGSRAFVYDDKLQLSTEILTGLFNRTITRTYAADEMVGRPTGFTIGTEYKVSYGYDHNGRFQYLGWNVLNNANMATHRYLEDSELLESVTNMTGQKVSYKYEPHRHLRTQVKNESGVTLISQYDYQYDALGRRESVRNSGSAFTVAAFNKFGYDDRNQVVESSRYLGADLEDVSNPVSTEQRQYDYDPIGNRNTATTAGAIATYTTNTLNQYIQVSGTPAQALGYDADGNLTDVTVDGVARKYTYNAENRLIAVEPELPIDGNKKVLFTYDFMGRRIRKAVYIFSSDSWLLNSEYLFLYDGWNMIEEITVVGAAEPSRYFVWGLDLSQSLQGAGGIGGLIAAIDGSLAYHYCYDGNGNVGQLVNAASGTIAAHYEYDPYGNLTNATGEQAGENPHRFSTKYFDQESNLYYYGYRYYSTEIGRWVSRDPVGERDGVNLYLFVSNNPTVFYDLLGLWDAGDHRRLTAIAFGRAEPSSGLDDYQVDISIFLQEANVSVDDDLLSDNRWHFNRDIDKNNENVENAIRLYKKLLTGQWKDMEEKIKEPNKENCQNALKIVGMLSHAWQDYYAHAIDINSDGSKETIRKIKGDPSAPGENIKPASWGYAGWKVLNIDTGEHGVSEPGSRAPDTQDRLTQAENYTKMKFREFLGIWVAPCKCYAKEVLR